MFLDFTIFSISYNNIILTNLNADIWDRGNVAKVWRGKKHQHSDDQAGLLQT